MKKVTIFDFEFDCAESLEEIGEAILNFEHDELGGKAPFLITPNVDDIVNWGKKENEPLKREFRKSFFVFPDGQPLVLFSRLIGKSLIRRTPGSSIFPVVWRKVKEQNKKAFLILANAELCQFYEKEYPLARTYFPPFFSQYHTSEISKIVGTCKAIIEEQQPHFVFVGIQFPKQNILALELSKNIAVSRKPLFLILGASMEYYSEHLKRSPVFFQKIGMEWFYRFCQQPVRLFKRYFINDTRIIVIFFKELFKNEKT